MASQDIVTRTWAGYLQTRADALVLVHACLSGKLPFSSTKQSCSGYIDGSIHVHTRKFEDDRIEDDNKWIYQDFDYAFRIYLSRRVPALWRKIAHIEVESIVYRVTAHFLSWSPVVGILQTPGWFFPTFKNLEERDLVQDNNTSVTYMEHLRCAMQVRPRRLMQEAILTDSQRVRTDPQVYLMNVVHLLAYWLDPHLHDVLIYHNRYGLFPSMLHDPGYWRRLSQIWIFQDKTPAELQHRTRSLLFRLIWISTEKYLGTYPVLLGNYSPLQNICLVMKHLGLGLRSINTPSAPSSHLPERKRQH